MTQMHEQFFSQFSWGHYNLQFLKWKKHEWEIYFIYESKPNMLDLAEQQKEARAWLISGYN